MKVYVLVVESAIDYSTDREIKVFAYYKDAKLAFNEEVERAQQDAGYDWVKEYSDLSFSTYENGDYINNHINVMVLEMEVIL